MDLIFLYYNFFEEPPKDINQFIAKIIELFPSIYDTKYIAAYQAAITPNYLQYIYLKCERENKSKQNKYYIACNHINPTTKLLIESDSDIRKSNANILCFTFAEHGHCPLGKICTYSHDLDLKFKEKSTMIKKKKNRIRCT